MNRLLLLLGFCAWSLQGASDNSKDVANGVQYQLLGEYDVNRLNKILTSELAEFSNFPMVFPPAVNPVRLYKVIYNTVIPEESNRPVRVSGLVAIPVGRAGTLPLLSYQHGTVFTRTAVPSSPEESMETRLMVARFAGQGYIVVASSAERMTPSFVVFVCPLTSTSGNRTSARTPLNGAHLEC